MHKLLDSIKLACESHLRHKVVDIEIIAARSWKNLCRVVLGTGETIFCEDYVNGATTFYIGEFGHSRLISEYGLDVASLHEATPIELP